MDVSAAVFGYIHVSGFCCGFAQVCVVDFTSLIHILWGFSALKLSRVDLPLWTDIEINLIMGQLSVVCGHLCHLFHP